MPENKFCMDWKEWKFSITCNKCGGSGQIEVNTMKDQKLGEQCSKCNGKGICSEKMPKLADRLWRNLICTGFIFLCFLLTYSRISMLTVFHLHVAASHVI